MEDQLANPTVDSNRKSALGSALQEFARANYSATKERERMGLVKGPVATPMATPMVPNSSAPVTNTGTTQAAPSSPAQPRYSDERLSTKDIMSMNMQKAVPGGKPYSGNDPLDRRPAPLYGKGFLGSQLDEMQRGTFSYTLADANDGRGTQYTPGRVTGTLFNPSTTGNIITPATPNNGLSRGLGYSEAERKRLFPSSQQRQLKHSV